MRYSAWLIGPVNDRKRAGLLDLGQRLRLVALRRPAAAHVLVDLRHALHERGPGVARARGLVRPLAAAAPLAAVIHRLDQRADHGVLVVGRDEPARLAV